MNSRRAAAIREQLLAAEANDESPTPDCPWCAEAVWAAALVEAREGYREELENAATGPVRSEELRATLAVLARQIDLCETPAAGGLH
jgi:hypothetical protein